jgi:transposase
LVFATDRGSSKSALCTLDTATGAVRHSTCRTQAARIRTLLQRPRPALVVIEISPLAALVHDVAVSLGIAIQVADATQDAWRWRNVKRQTDRDYARKLARLAALGQLNPVHLPEPQMRPWRALVEYRQTPVAERTRVKNRIRQVVLVHAGHRPRADQSGWSPTARAGVEPETKNPSPSLS